MVKKITDKRGTALLVWILAIAVIVMAIIVAIPILLDTDGSRARATDEGHEQTCLDSARLEALTGGFEAVYDYHGKKFVRLNEHPYQVQAYGSTKEHEDCVILVRAKSADSIDLMWISRKTLRERYR